MLKGRNNFMELEELGKILQSINKEYERLESNDVPLNESASMEYEVLN